MIAIPPILEIPPVPQRGMDDEQFVQLADAFMNALPLFRGNLNAFALAFTAAFLDLSTVKFTATSATAVTIGTGAKAFNATAGVAFSVGQAVMVASAADSTRYMQGSITSYDAQSGALTVSVTAIGAAGTRSDWRISLVPAFDIEQRLATFGQPINDRLTLLAPTSNWAAATNAEARAGTASRLLSAAIQWSMQAYVALEDAASVAPDLSAGSNFTWTIGGNRVLANPTNAKAGQQWTVLVTQGGVGGFVMSFGSAYVPDDLATYPLLNAAALAVTELRMRCTNDGKIRVSGGRPPAGSAAQVNGYQGGESAFVQGSYQPIFVLLGRTGKFAPESCVVYSNGQTPSAGLVLKITINGAQVGSATFDGNSKYATVTFTTLNFNKGDFVALNPSASGAYPSAAVGVNFVVAFT